MDNSAAKYAGGGSSPELWLMYQAQRRGADSHEFPFH